MKITHLCFVALLGAVSALTSRHTTYQGILDVSDADKLHLIETLSRGKNGNANIDSEGICRNAKLCRSGGALKHKGGELYACDLFG